jgi:hypothetical protein
MSLNIANLIMKHNLCFLHVLPMFTPSLARKLSGLWIRVLYPVRIRYQKRIGRRKIKLLASVLVPADGLFGRFLVAHMDVATAEGRKASRSRAFDSPLPGECMDAPVSRNHGLRQESQRTDSVS